MTTRTLLLAALQALWAPTIRAAAQDFEDPAPPRREVLEAMESPGAADHPDLTVRGEPRALSASAVTEDWPSFRGPRRDGRSRETRLLVDWPESGPELLWEVARGSGFTSPVIVGDRLVMAHRQRDRIHVDCLHPETGRRYWRHSYETDYRPRYISDDGPSSTPTIHGDRVYLQGLQNQLMCLELETGRVVWQRDLGKEFGLREGFFGVVSSPLVHGDLLIVNAGPPARSVMAFDLLTGKVAWAVGSEWGASCASPIVGTVGGKERLFVLTGGESRPPTGGLMVLDPVTGALEFTHPFRSRTSESVNGATPVLGEDSVYLTAAYGVGTSRLSLTADKMDRDWHTRRLGIEFSTPILDGDRLWMVDGRSDRAGAVVSLDIATGLELTRTDLSWEEETIYRGGRRELSIGLGAGSLLHVEGKLLVLGDNGHLAWLEPGDEGVEVLASAWLFGANKTWTPPVISHGLLYVCQNTPERFGDARRPPRLLCYDLRGE